MKKGELVARLEAQELDAQKTVRRGAARPDRSRSSQNARLDRERARQLLDEKIGTAAGVRHGGRAGEGARGPGRVRRGPGPLLRRADQERRDLRADRRRRDRQEGVPRRDRRAAGLRRRRLGGRDVRRHRGPLLARDGSRHQRAERREARPSPSRPRSRSTRTRTSPTRRACRQIVPTADRQKGSVKVKIEILGKDARVLPEMSCRVVFLNPEAKVDEKAKPKVMVPAALRRRRRRREGRPRRRERQGHVPARSRSAPRPARRSRSTSGLSGGEEIVADAASASHTWRGEQKIRIKKD